MRLDVSSFETRDDRSAARLIWLSGFSLAGALLLLAGCSAWAQENGIALGPSEEEQVARVAVTDEIERLGGIPNAQEEALADGEVTFEEYERAAFEYKACMEDSGSAFAGFNFSAERQMYEWLVDSEADPNGCYDSLFRIVDRIWQARVFIDQADEREARRLRLVGCLIDEDLPVDASAPLNEILIFAGQNGFDSLECR